MAKPRKPKPGPTASRPSAAPNPNAHSWGNASKGPMSASNKPQGGTRSRAPRRP